MDFFESDLGKILYAAFVIFACIFCALGRMPPGVKMFPPSPAPVGLAPADTWTK